MLLFKGLQGLGFGGEFAAGAVLIAEIAPARHRGRIMGFVASSYAVGWALAVLAYSVIFSHAGPDAWRYLFILGIIPAFALIFIRRNVKDSDASKENRRRVKEASATRCGADSPNCSARPTAHHAADPAGRDRSAGRVLRHLHLAAVLPAQGARSDGRRDQRLPLGHHRRLLPRLHDPAGTCTTGSAAGRRTSSSRSAAWCAWSPTPGSPRGQQPAAGAGRAAGDGGVRIAGRSGVFFSELFPSRVRGAGVGIAHNFGRGVAAFFPALVGVLSSILGLKAAMGIGALGYVLVIVGVLALPETRGRQIA
ncbi:MFS transporter [Streptomyces sp. F001]|nr:MFS transporter [Streptomyces sp. F001]